MIGGFKWELLYFPNGNAYHPGRDHPGFSVYLKALSDTGIFRRPAKFRLIVKNHKGGAVHSKEADHIFSPRNDDRGFSTLLSLEDLYDPESAFLKDDHVHVLVKTLVYFPSIPDVSIWADTENRPRPKSHHSVLLVTHKNSGYRKNEHDKHEFEVCWYESESDAEVKKIVYRPYRLTSLDGTLLDSCDCRLLCGCYTKMVLDSIDTVNGECVICFDAYSQ